MKTCEFVTPKHPDKLCDYIADTLLDEYLAQDPASRVALEILGGHGLITIMGEVTSQGTVPIPDCVRSVVGPGFEIRVQVTKQSPEIARGVDAGGAGDQGIMVGYASAETDSSMPREYELSRNLCRELFKLYPFDGKTQVTIDGDTVQCVVASFQNARTPELEKHVRSLIVADEYLINSAGEWSSGGFDADSGLTGRKVIVDNYGPEYPVGGGSFSGKDPSKVDRSAAYMARRIAVDYLKKYGAKNVAVKLAYAIGKKDPVMAYALVDGAKMPLHGYDLTPRGIGAFLGLYRPIYRYTAQWGHFGNGFPWG